MKRVAAILIISIAASIPATGVAWAQAPPAETSVFAKGNLVAWCIVPFDAGKRGPRERAEMLNRLGIRGLAYDWRAEHVPSFEDEILQSKEHGIEFFAFWSFHPEIAPLIRKHGIAPQIWMTVPNPQAETQAQRVKAAAEQLLPLVDQARQLGCKLGLYNHGGWGGEPENMVAVARWLQENVRADHVGIVYNLHHGHGHIQDFAEALALMKPLLLCVNLNGMNENGNPKILPIGSGQHEQKMMETIRQSGYTGPIGILDHREALDAEESLTQNLEGMKKVLKQIGDEAALGTYK